MSKISVGARTSRTYRVRVSIFRLADIHSGSSEDARSRGINMDERLEIAGQDSWLQLHDFCPIVPVK